MYDAMTINRVYCAAQSPLEVLRMLYDQRHYGYDAEYEEQFIQCLGIYPVGSIVALNNGEVGVVVSVNREQQLRPKVMLVLAPDKER